MTRKGNPESLNNATRGFNQRGLPGANPNGLRAMRQIAQSRSFVYDGSLAPVCLGCGGLRERTRGLRCANCTGDPA